MIGAHGALYEGFCGNAVDFAPSQGERISYNSLAICMRCTNTLTFVALFICASHI